MPKFNIDFFKDKYDSDLYDIFRSKKFKGSTHLAFYLIARNNDDFYIKMLLKKLSYEKLTRSVCKVKLLHLLIYNGYNSSLSYLISRLKSEDLNQEDIFGQTALGLCNDRFGRFNENVCFIEYDENTKKFYQIRDMHFHQNISTLVQFKLIDNGAYDYGYTYTLDCLPDKYINKILQNASSLSLTQLNDKFYVYNKFYLLNLGIDQRLKFNFDNRWVAGVISALHSLKSEGWLCMF